jgi:hypothetical protein
MGFLDKLKKSTADVTDKASGVVAEHGDKIDEGIDKAADLADDKTGGKFDDKIDTGADKLKDGLDSLDGKDDDIP